MKRVVVPFLAVLALGACSAPESAPAPVSSGTVATTAASPSVTASEPATTSAPASPSRVPSPKATTPGTTSFCDYLEKTAGAQQQVEDPAQFVQLVNGALAVAPGAIREDLALYAESVQKLADSVTAGPKKAAAADAWLSENEAAITQAEDNLNAYSESTCGRPFITGEG